MASAEVSTIHLPQELVKIVPIFLSIASIVWPHQQSLNLMEMNKPPDTTPPSNFLKTLKKQEKKRRGPPANKFKKHQIKQTPNFSEPLINLCRLGISKMGIY